MVSKVTDGPLFFHIDVNSAFLSWSAVKALEEGGTVDLRTIPSIVGGDQDTRHGIVTARSIPAKKYGIKTADTVASAFQKCPTLVMVPPDMAYYREKSAALMELLSGICPEIEQVSVDECYMSFEPIRGRFASPVEAADFIRNSVREQLKFTVNVGISDRKVLAKMASDMQKPDKVHTLYASEIQEKMWGMPIGDLYMCGKSSAARMISLGITTIGDLAKADRQMIRSLFKSHGELLWEYANGIDDSRIVTEKAQAKGVGNSVTLSKDVSDRNEALRVLRQLSQSVSTRLKKHSFLAGSVTVEIKYATFQSVSHQGPTSRLTSEAGVLYEQAVALFDELWTGEPIRLLGLRTTKLEEEGAPIQLNLFDYQREQEEKQKSGAVEEAMKKINDRFGDGAIKKGS